jgi:hypothetical protein
MPTSAIQNRAAGAIMGSFTGEAMGVGPHWYYGFDEQHRDHGEWITDCMKPKPGRDHAGFNAGQLSQPGIILNQMLRSLTDCGSYTAD